MKHSILIVDDELSMREFLSILLEREGYGVKTASSAEEALALLEHTIFDLVISDVQMPGLSGIDLLTRIKALSPETAVLIITAFSTAEQAVEAMKIGAYDYIAKPFKIDEVKQLVINALEKQGLKRENIVLKQKAAEKDAFGGMIGKSRKMQEMYDILLKVAGSASSVLILGESGTGKELAARAVHTCSPRKNKPFVAVNCGAIPESLIESELFGHKKGSFTGAISDRPGLFEQAEGGTLFLDEIGELPLLLQTKLLRVLQEREFRRVGCAVVRKTDVRIICASNRDLEAQVAEGSFREDLYYRINVVQVTMPPLRERVEDITLLVEHFCVKFSRNQSQTPGITPEAVRLLINYGFPGNVRELENIVERCLVLDPTTITVETLPRHISRAEKKEDAAEEIILPESGFDLEAHLEGIERAYLLKALEKSGGGKKKAAALLGMTFRSFRYRLSKLGLGGD